MTGHEPHTDTIPSFVVDPAVLPSLPAYYRALAEVLVEHGVWRMAEGSKTIA